MGAASRCLMLALALLLCGSLLSASAAASRSSEMLLMTSRFHAWRAAHNRTYATAAERQRRFEVYRRNVEYIEATNRRGELSYQLGENQFTDLTSEEFLAAYTMPPGQVLAARADDVVSTRQLNDSLPRNSSYSGNVFGQVPYSVDWRASGAVTPIKHQMTCGSCWAFATVASIESLYKIRTGRLVSLSEQELVDCTSPPNFGCGGGDPATAMWWVARNGGLATAWEYPYENQQGQCRRGRIRLGRVRGGVAVPPNSEAALERAVAQQPVVVSINGTTLQHYKSGVLSGPCDAGINHAVTVVGYGADIVDHKLFWIVKNSWGNAWGENGYGRMERRVGVMGGLCGIASSPYYPVM